MDEFFVRHKVVNEKSFKYFYRLTKNRIKIASKEEGIFTTQSYGIEIERHDIINNILVNIEKNSVNHISPHWSKVNNILTYLFENSVSPIHLVDIIGPDTDENVLDYNYDSLM